jgi:NAD(P)-dependent dehydrogenase (short-subunit alcohol dehydrogenase family)
MLPLAGKVVLITGASSGVGAAACEAFARAGADVALLARNEEALERAAAPVRAQGRRALVLPADVTDAAAVDEAVHRCEQQLGRLDVVVPNAAATIYGRFSAVPARDAERVLAVTYTGAVNVVRAALPGLTRSRGSIVATGSLMSKLPLPGWSSYAAAKHALRGFLGSLRVELAAERSPVSVSMVHPGAIDTAVWTSTTTASGRLPRTPPEGYHAAVVARALVACAIHPRAEVTIGLTTKVTELLFAFARPLGDLALMAIHLYYRSGRRPAGPGMLWDPVPAGAAAPNHMRGRRSLWAPVRLARGWRAGG